MNSRSSKHHIAPTIARLPGWLTGFLVVTVVAWLLSSALYFYTFHGNLSKTHEVWGQFGDFFGGTLNPIFAFMSFIALLHTINLQSEQVAHTEEALRITEGQVQLQAQHSRKQLTASVLLELRHIWETDEMSQAVHYIDQLRKTSLESFQRNRYAFARNYLSTVEETSVEWRMRRRVSHFYGDVAALVEAGCIDENDFFSSYGNTFEIIEFLEPIEVAIAERWNALPLNYELVALRLLARGRKWQAERVAAGLDPRFTLPRDPDLYEQSKEMRQGGNDNSAA